MKQCQNYQNMFAEAYYRELTARKLVAFNAHLRECADCAAAFEKMQSALNLMDRRELPELKEPEWRAARENLYGKLNYDPAATRRLREKIAAIMPPISNFRVAPALRLAGAAALILVGVFLGRIYFPQQTTTVVAEKQNYTIPLQNAAVRDAHDYLQKSKVLLLGISNLDASRKTEFIPNLSRQKEMSRELIDEAADLKEKLNSPPERRLRQLISDLEVILLQIANLENNHDLREVELIQRGVEQRALLFKIVIEEMDESAQPVNAKNEKQKI